MFIINILNFGTGSAQVSIVGSIDEQVRPLPALSQSINQNSITKIPESGVYYANLQGQNMAILGHANLEVCLQNPNFKANGSAFTYQAYDSSLGNGTGQQRKQEANEKREIDRIEQFKVQYGKNPKSVIVQSLSKQLGETVVKQLIAEMQLVGTPANVTPANTQP